MECQAITGNKLTIILDARSFVAYQMNSIILSMRLELFIILRTTFVAIAADGVMTARTGHLKAPIKADETQSHTYVFKNIKSKNVIQKKENLRVCVLLINTNTGKIENAAKCSISEFKTTGISSVSEGTRTAVEAERYTLDGRRITTPQKGINIVKYSDGRVSKEVVTD